MERYSLEYIEASEKWIEESRKQEKVVRTASGILIGVGIGGWVSLGMSPSHAIELVLLGTGLGLGGARIVLERQHFKETGRQRM